MSSGSQTVNRYEVPLWRILFVYALIVGVVSVIVYRLFALQVMSQPAWTGQAVDNFQETLSDPAPRGIIYDRNGYILARNLASYNVVITPAGLPDDEADIQLE
jgi:penicillin-binding protein 2